MIILLGNWVRCDGKRGVVQDIDEETGVYTIFFSFTEETVERSRSEIELI